ncbi:uncharacterized protein LTR77_008886 [Saxophila tyrrhenica]|uniref:Uncharacterized protein n=1 Tax=Saxophila tyrrhenica TaxID=1690608 RepID=A0AAV9P0J8_9PEZI|nr:hypothetical protein LTR77_008886 [Saxophila tyrrhenica]
MKKTSSITQNLAFYPQNKTEHEELSNDAMPPLTSVIQIIPPDKDEEIEDIFACAPGLIFTDDTRNHHGDPGSTIVYKSARFGDIDLKTTDPEREEERQLFGHYLWNAGIKLAELVSEEDDGRWSVKGRRVLELGAGVGLCGIVATLAGAEEVVISDYPAPVVLENIRRNAKHAIPERLASAYSIEGHEWGELGTDFATKFAGRFDRILAADCFWMPSQHSNLVQSTLHFLAPDGRVFAIAGFHTGRAKLAAFFDVAVEEGLEIEEIWEEDVDGVRREWAKTRDGGREDVTGRKRWLVLAILKRRMRGS